MPQYKNQHIFSNIRKTAHATIDQEERWNRVVRTAIQYKLWEKTIYRKDDEIKKEEITLAQKEAALNQAEKPIHNLYNTSFMLLKMSGFRPHVQMLEDLLFTGIGFSLSQITTHFVHRMSEKCRLEEHKRLIVEEVARKMKDRNRREAYREFLKQCSR